MVVNIGEKSEIYLKAYLLREKDKKYTSTIFKRITQLSDDGNLDKLKWVADAEEYLQSYDVENLKKELDTINEAAGTFNAELSMSKMASEVYQNAMDAGFSDIDYTGILAHLKKINQ